MPPVADATAEVRSSPVTMNLDALLRTAQQFGLPLVMLAVILWWMKNDFVQPLLDAHFQVVGKIVQGQADHTERLDNIGDKLDELIRVTK
jgi:hypothetical protein